MVTGLDAVALCVDDQRMTADFHTDVLGLAVLGGAEAAPGERRFETGPPGGVPRIVLYPEDGREGPREAPPSPS
ncbi:hypothetical protein J0910_15970 [Nocardiopsis sp. CNT-189]|uniref:VOC family protein n=1 Tax=Nocardiopsis oceanisediminis TaxID=2816862 RepID=UPI003B38563A